MQQRSRDSVFFVKVKGHATEGDVTAGRVRPEDKAGNDAADGLACAGADEHAMSNDIVTKTVLHRHAAVEVQKMMLSILAARRATMTAMGHGLWQLRVP